MADKSKERKSKEDKKREKAEKKALKKEAKETKKKTKANSKLDKENTKQSATDSADSTDKEKPTKKKSFLTIKKLILFSALILILIGSVFFIYKTYFIISDEPVEYKSVLLKNVNLPDEMLEFSFYQVNDLYFALVNYNLRIFLLTKEIDRINKIGADYPDQNTIADKEKKNWIKAKEKVEKIFLKTEKQIKEIYVLYNVNKEEGKIKIEEKNKELLIQATEALATLDPYIEKIEINKEQEPQGFINNTINKIKNIF